MKNELDEKLCKAFPKIFAQRGLPMTETCMCWGFDCGDGWYDIINELCKKIQEHCDKEGFQVEATQVKEKFGGLRFYTTGADDAIWELIATAEDKSVKTCEICGSTEDVSQPPGSWIRTLCKKCNK